MTPELPAIDHIRVFLADANPMFLEAAARCLASDGYLALVGRAATGVEALRKAADLQLDLVLVDLGLPDVNGLEVAREIKSWPHPPRVVVLAFDGGDAYAEAARYAGADGFVAKIDFYAQVYRLIHAWYPRSGEAAESTLPDTERAGSALNARIV